MTRATPSPIQVTPSSVGSAYVKVERARQHLEILKIETARVIERNPREVVPEDDPDTGHIVMRFRLPKGPFRLPTRLGLIAGDAVHNLRSALDHLAYQLAILDSGAGNRSVQFPIFLDADDYRSNEKRLLKGIIERHRAQIESLQPYHARKAIEARGPEFSPNDPLAVNFVLLLIHRLDNMDKHRLLLPTSALSPWKQPKFGGVKYANGTYPGNMVRVEDGAELYRITDFEMLPGYTQVEVKTKATFTIAFGDAVFGALGEETDIWSEDKGTANRGDLVFAADIVERVIGMFSADFPAD